MRSRAERIGDQIDRLGGVAREDDLFLALGVEKRPHGLARALVGFGRLVGEVMQAAMHVGVLLGIGLLDAVEHLLRLLRRGRVVEIDQRLAIDLHRQRGKIRADFGDVVGAVADRRMHGQPRVPSHFSAANISASRMASLEISSITSPMKACTSKRFGFLLVDAARHQIEFQRLVGRRNRGAVAADHVVGKDFQFRLVVGFRFVRKQQRARHHLGVGLLRVLAHHDLALENATAFVVEHRLELLAAFAVARRMIDQKRRVDVFLALEQADAANGALGALAGKAHEHLVAHQLRIGVEGETVEGGVGANRCHQARDMQSRAPAWSSHDRPARLRQRPVRARY